MKDTGPHIDFPVPAESIIVCWGCGDWLYITINEIPLTQGLEKDQLVDIRSGEVILAKEHYRNLKCQFCDNNIYRSYGQNRGLVRYIPKPETLGERIHHFMVQGAYP
jgi:hypothetical protein